MHNHEPHACRCPLCCVVQGVEEPGFPYTRQADVVYRDGRLTAFIASHWWPNNPGHALIVPNRHVENPYDMPEDDLAAAHALSRRIAIALKAAYGCDGVSVRQHNEPAGDQDVWHYHLHVFPRYANDRLYAQNDLKYLSKPGDRLPFAEKLRNALAEYLQSHA